MVSALALSAPSVSLNVPKGWIEDVAKARAKAALQGRFAYSADEKAAAKVGILKDHIDLLKAIAEQIGNEAAAQVNARISELEAMARAMDKDRHSNRQPRKP